MNAGQQVRFKIPATVDQTRQIAITVFEAEAKEKRDLAFFQIPKCMRRIDVTLVSPGRPLEGDGGGGSDDPPPHYRGDSFFPKTQDCIEVIHFSVKHNTA